MRSEEVDYVTYYKIVWLVYIGCTDFKFLNTFVAKYLTEYV